MRLDYTAEVFGQWAKAAHYCWDHKNFSGLIVPTRRRVFPRTSDAHPRTFPTLVWIELMIRLSLRLFVASLEF
jgi:hypothetical protein